MTTNTRPDLVITPTDRYTIRTTTVRSADDGGVPRIRAEVMDNLIEAVVGTGLDPDQATAIALAKADARSVGLA